MRAATPTVRAYQSPTHAGRNVAIHARAAGQFGDPWQYHPNRSVALWYAGRGWYSSTHFTRTIGRFQRSIS